MATESRSLDTMANNVANNIMASSDTSLKTLIKVWLNKRYMQVLRAINWEAINDDYTISLTAGTQDYDLPSDYNYSILGSPLETVSSTQLVEGNRYTIYKLVIPDIILYVLGNYYVIQCNQEVK